MFDMRRRELITLLGGAVVALPFAARAQQPRKIWRVGALQPGGPPDPLLEMIKDGLRDLGYVEGRGLVFEVRWAEGKHDRLAGLVIG
jgi:putative ABC transport system substrate-binding protein